MVPNGVQLVAGRVGHWKLWDVANKFLPGRLSYPWWWQRWQSEPWDAVQQMNISTSWLGLWIFWIAWFSVELVHKNLIPLPRALSWLLKPLPFLLRLLFVWQQNLESTKSHHVKTGIRFAVEMLGNTGTAKDHLQPWFHHSGTESQLAHFHSRTHAVVTAKAIDSNQGGYFEQMLLLLVQRFVTLGLFGTFRFLI